MIGNVKLGLGPTYNDPRTLKYSTVRLSVPGWRPPSSYSWDAEHPGAVSVPMFLNDRYGDCVIAGRAHQTLRFQRSETGVTPVITDDEVKNEYFAETGGPDVGLVETYSLNDWRNKGWIAGGRRLFIHSWLGVNWLDHDEVKESMLVGIGVRFGVRLPLAASDQINSGAPWTPTDGARGRIGSWGGHLVHTCAYDAEGVIFETWGKRQKATWAWCDKYTDQCSIVIDDIARAEASDLIGSGRIADAIAAI